MFGGPPKGFSNQDLEDELAMVLNGGKRPAKKPQQKAPSNQIPKDTGLGGVPVDWGDLSKMINSAMTGDESTGNNGGGGGDDDFDDFDEGDLMDELNELTGNDEITEIVDLCEKIMNDHLSQARQAKALNDQHKVNFHIQMVKQAKSWIENPESTDLESVEKFSKQQFTVLSSGTICSINIVTHSIPAVQQVSSPEWNAKSKQPPPDTIDLAQALFYRVQRYQNDVAENAGTSKARRLGRVLKQHEDLYKLAKAGRPVPPAKLSALPDMVGWPALPGAGPQKPQKSLEDAVNSAMTEPTEEEEENTSFSSQNTPIPPQRRPPPPSKPVPPRPVQNTHLNHSLNVPSSVLLQPSTSNSSLTPSTSALDKSPRPVNNTTSPQAQLANIMANSPKADDPVKLLNEAILNYRTAAVSAKRDNDKDTAMIQVAMMKSVQDVLTRYQENRNSVSKQEIESVVGRPVILPETSLMVSTHNSQINTAPMTLTPPKISQLSPKPLKIQETSPDTQETKAEPQTAPNPTMCGPTSPLAPVQATTAWEIKSGNPPPYTTSLTDALHYRVEKYKYEVEKSTSEGNSSKARRMKRQVTTHLAAWKKAKAGNIGAAELQALPEIPGWPNLPGVSAKPVLSLDDAVGAALSDSVSAPNVSAPTVNSPPQNVNLPRPSRSAPAVSNLKPISGLPAVNMAEISAAVNKHQSNNPSNQSGHQAQIELLTTRITQFKKAALKAKNAGEIPQAKEYLASSKGIEALLEHAKSGRLVNIRDIPEAPVEIDSRRSMKETAGNQQLNRQLSDSEKEIYQRLTSQLSTQSKRFDGYAKQYQHGGDVQKANKFLKLSQFSKQELDIVKSKMYNNNPPPAAAYSSQNIQVAQINPNIQDAELFVTIVGALNIKQSELKDFTKGFYYSIKLPNGSDEPPVYKTQLYNSVSEIKHLEKISVQKNKNFERIIRNRSIYLELFAKGGFMRSDIRVGQTAVKLLTLLNKCNVEEQANIISDKGRKQLGKLHVKIQLNRPLLNAESVTRSENFICLETNKTAFLKYFEVPNLNKQNEQLLGGKKMYKSIEVLKLEYKMIQAKSNSYINRGSQVPARLATEEQKLVKEYQETNTFIQEPKNLIHYATCLRALLPKYTQEYQAAISRGARDAQAKLAGERLNLVKKELESLGGQQYC